MYLKITSVLLLFCLQCFGHSLPNSQESGSLRVDNISAYAVGDADGNSKVPVELLKTLRLSNQTGEGSEQRINVAPRTHGMSLRGNGGYVWNALENFVHHSLENTKEDRQTLNSLLRHTSENIKEERQNNQHNPARNENNNQHNQARDDNTSSTDLNVKITQENHGNEDDGENDENIEHNIYSVFQLIEALLGDDEFLEFLSLWTEIYTSILETKIQIEVRKEVRKQLNKYFENKELTTPNNEDSGTIENNDKYDDYTENRLNNNNKRKQRGNRESKETDKVTNEYNISNSTISHDYINNIFITYSHKENEGNDITNSEQANDKKDGDENEIKIIESTEKQDGAPEYLEYDRANLNARSRLYETGHDKKSLERYKNLKSFLLKELLKLN